MAEDLTFPGGTTTVHHKFSYPQTIHDSADPTTPKFKSLKPEALSPKKGTAYFPKVPSTSESYTYPKAALELLAPKTQVPNYWVLGP